MAIDEKLSFEHEALGWEQSSGWTITSYGDVNEGVYEEPKLEVFDKDHNSLGFYRKDFLQQVKIDGSGVGDGVKNPGRHLHYDFDVDDEVSHYLSDYSRGAWENELSNWTAEKPSIAMNPPAPKGTMVRFVDLGADASENPKWVNELLLNKTFYVDDKFYLPGSDEKKIDIYTGLQKVKDPSGTAESLLMRNVKIEIKYP